MTRREKPSPNDNRNTGSRGVNRREATAGLAAAVTIGGTSPIAPNAEAQEDTHAMEKVTGIGGFFFIATYPEALRTWYKEHLGVEMAPQFSGGAPWHQDAGYTVFDPFPRDNEMIPPAKSWMINFRVGDLGKMVAQLRSAGVQVADIDDYPHGRFTTLADPEGNPIQLWQPTVA